MDIVRVKMLDMSYNNDTWARKDIKGFSLIELDIVGWLVEDREDCVIVAKEYMQEDDQFRSLSAIPKVCIKEIKKL